MTRSHREIIDEYLIWRDVSPDILRGLVCSITSQLLSCAMPKLVRIMGIWRSVGRSAPKPPAVAFRENTGHSPARFMLPRIYFGMIHYVS